jgi:multiple sugar transport system substrate-binding protein
MRRQAARLGGLACAAVVLGAVAAAAPTGPLIFLSTQLRPIAEAQKMRNLILADFPREVDYITEEPQQFAELVAAERQGGPRAIDVVGGLHGDLQPLAARGVLAPLGDLAHRLESRGIPNSLLTLGKFGTAEQLAMPWMQASYILVANKKALSYLPRDADIDALSYDQLAVWAGTLQAKTGRRLLGFPAGPQGLMHRFFEGFLYPSYTGGVVVPFRSAAAEAMWTRFAALWKSVNPNSTGYNFVRQPLLSGDVWIGWDHVARLLEALRQKPDEFVAFPVPSGPKGRGYMPVLAGLAVPRDAPDMTGAAALIDYLSQPQTQIVTARTVGFFPVVKAVLPPDFDPGVKLAAAAIAQMQSAKDALPALPPSGFGGRGGEFDRVFMATFQRVVLRGEPARAALDAGAERLNRLMSETGAMCWQPDPPSTGPCRVQ